MTLLLKKPTGAKLKLAKSAVIQDYMWDFPSLYGLWSPSNISNLVWMDAADSSAVVAANGAVSQWKNKGSASNARQTDTAKQPAYTASGLNGRNVVTFDGSNDCLSFVAPIAMSNWSRFIVATPSQVANAYVFGTANQDVLISGYNALDFEFFAAPGGRFTIAASAPGPRIIYLEKTGTTVTARLDGVAVPGSPVSVNASYQGDYQISGANATPSSPFKGYIAEIVSTAAVLTVSDRQKAEGYLAHKWGLTANLPSDHPYKTVVPTP